MVLDPAKAEPDGLTLGIFTPRVVCEQLLGDEEIRFDFAKMTFIGKLGHPVVV